MALSEKPGAFRIADEDTAPRRLSLLEFLSVRAFFVTIGIRPGMALGHHPASNVLALYVHGGNGAAIVVMRPKGNGYALPERLAFQRLTRLHAAQLANFRRINALYTHF